MSKRKSKKYYKNKLYKKEWEKIYYIIPLIIAVAIVPLIVGVKVVHIKEQALQEVLQGNTVTDVFSFYKSRVIIACAIMSIILLIIKMKAHNYKIRKSRYYKYMAGYCLCVILSTIFSEYPGIALNGAWDRHEGMIVVLSYMILMFAAMNLVETEKHIKIIIYSLFISAAIICIIGILQYLGHDIFATDIGKRILLHKYYAANKDNEIGLMQNVAYATLFNPNYVGSYTVMVSMLAIGLFFNKDNKIKNYIFLFIIAALSTVTLICSKSSAGMLGFIVAGIAAVIIFRKELLKKYILVIILVCIAAAGVIATNKITDGKITETAKNSLSEIKENIDIILHGEDDSYVDKITIDYYKVTVKTKGATLNVCIDEKDSSLYFTDMNNEILEYEFDGSWYKFSNEKYIYFKILDEKNGYLRIYSENKLFWINKISGVFTNCKNNYYEFYPEEKKWPEKIRLDRLANNRGYIWTRSLQLAVNKPIFGYGSDTLPIFIPQKELEGITNCFGFYYSVIDKAHSWYIQIIYSTGIISFILILIMIILYVTKRKNETDIKYNRIIHNSIYLTLIGYITAGFFNDSRIGIAPVFWILFGISIDFSKKYNNK